jgi:hypothetical protein
VIGVRKAGALLAAGQPVAVKGHELVLAFTAANARNFQSSGIGEELLREALNDRFGGSWKISYVHRSPDNGSIQLPPDEPPPSPSEQPDAVADGERARAYDPVAAAIEVLGAQIVEERETG